MRYLNSIIIVAVISLLSISPALAHDNFIRCVAGSWNRRADHLRDLRHDRQEWWQDQLHRRREYRRDQWNNMRNGAQHSRDRGDFNWGGGQRGGGHRRRHH